MGSPCTQRINPNKQLQSGLRDENTPFFIFWFLLGPPSTTRIEGGGWDVDEPNFEQLVLEAQKELAKSLQNLTPVGKVLLVHQRRVPGTVWEVLNYALKQGRKMNTNVQNQ